MRTTKALTPAVYNRSPNAPSFRRGFESQPEEFAYWVDEIEGKIPHNLQATLFRNGPGRNEMGGERYGHWFDGPGMVNQVSFVEGRVHYQNKYVRTPSWVNENKNQKLMYRRYGTKIPGGFFKNALRAPANAANTNVVWHGGKLLALYEGGRPWELDPSTLKTRGVFDYHGALRLNHFFSAHGKIDPRTGYYYNFGNSFYGVGLQGIKVGFDVYQINPRGKIEKSCRIDTPRFPFLHDFALTEHYAIFFLSPVVMEDMLKMGIGLTSALDATQYKPELGVEVYVVELATMKVVKRFETDPAFILHFGNAYEKEDEIFVHFVRFDGDGAVQQLKDSNVFEWESVKGAPYVQYQINLKQNRIRWHAIDSVPPGDFPQWDMRLTGVENRYTYFATSNTHFLNCVGQLDQQTGQVQIHDFGPHRFTSEAVFLAKPGATRENEGYVYCFVYDAKRHATDVVLLDGEDIQQQVASAKLHHHVPYGFHGFATDQVFLKEQTRRR